MSYKTKILAMMLFFNLSYMFGQDCSNRPKFTGFSQAETDKIMEYVCGPIVQFHVEEMPANHFLENFLPWHREYIQGLEEFLANEGFSNLVPLPAWNPCDVIPDSPPFQDSILTNCPEVDAMPPGYLGESIDCHDFETNKYTCSELCTFDDFEDFASTLQADHDRIHNAFDEGDVVTPFSSPQSPGILLFWPWHAFVDDIYLKYQAATLDPDLPLNIEFVSEDCCELTFRAPRYCCSEVTWSIDNPKANSIIDDWSTDDYWFMTASVLSSPGYTVNASYTGTCGNSKTVSRSFISPMVTLPTLPTSPPLHLQDICMDDDEKDNCYVFQI